MKIHTTNYFDTFITVAEDCPTEVSEIPESKVNNRTVAALEYYLIHENPYKFTSDDILFTVYAVRQNLPESDYEKARQQFFAKPQPCFRSSPLTKRYGFGVHSDHVGKIAIFGRETDEYQQFVSNDKIKKLKAMRTTKK